MAGAAVLMFSKTCSLAERRPEILKNVDAPNESLFVEGQEVFLARSTPEAGLRPSSNATSCVSCHHVPTAGGAGELADTVVFPGRAARVELDNLEYCGAPIFPQFAVRGTLRKPVHRQANVRAVRMPPPLYGLGLIEEIPDDAILANADPQDSDSDGISGRPNYVDGRLGRFGVKAQVPSLFEFMFGAALNELGLTSPFQRREVLNSCEAVQREHTPEPELSAQEVFQLMYFVKFLAPPKAKRQTDIEQAGNQVFQHLRCSKCHIPTFRTKASNIRAFDQVEVTLYSDLLLHDMGEVLSDGIVDGLATGREFRTPPLWGVRDKKRFLHDGRAATIEDAIEAHGGEADHARAAFGKLDKGRRYALLAFLNSL